jgi:hypothetical protein
MKSRGWKSATADLFADGSAAGRLAETLPAIVAEARPAILRGVPPLEPAVVRPYPKQLWYAVVFPDLMEPQRLAA